MMEKDKKYKVYFLFFSPPSIIHHEIYKKKTVPKQLLTKTLKKSILFNQ